MSRGDAGISGDAFSGVLLKEFFHPPVRAGLASCQPRIAGIPAPQICPPTVHIECFRAVLLPSEMCSSRLWLGQVWGRAWGSAYLTSSQAHSATWVGRACTARPRVSLLSWSGPFGFIQPVNAHYNVAPDSSWSRKYELNHHIPYSSWTLVSLQPRLAVFGDKSIMLLETPPQSEPSHFVPDLTEWSWGVGWGSRENSPPSPPLPSIKCLSCLD